MPIGVLIDVFSVFFGGLVGFGIKDRLSNRLIEGMTMICGLASLGMGITSINVMENMPAVVFSLIIGTAAGILFRLGNGINRVACMMQNIAKEQSGEDSVGLVAVIVLFCASGTGIYGSLISGISGDHTILITKSILDFFTAVTFGCVLGRAVSLIAIPQFAVMFILFLIARQIIPLTTAGMINDLKACGGFLMLATGFKILKLKEFPTADMLPAMLLVMPLSCLWNLLLELL